MLFILGRSPAWGKEPPVMTTREELKTKAAREEWAKNSYSGFEKNGGG